MRVATVGTFGSPEVLEFQDVPDASAGAGQVLIEVDYAGVNYFDVLQRKGLVPGVELPFVPGLEVSGRIAEVGEGVTGFHRHRRVMAIVTGGYAELVAVDHRCVVDLDAESLDIDMGVASALPVSAVTAFQVLNDVARVRPGETVLVHGAAGAVGTLLSQVARVLGVHKVIGTVSTPEKAAYAAGQGYDDVLPFEGFVDATLALTAGRGVDVVVETAGGINVPRSQQVLGPMGRLVYMGDPDFSSVQQVGIGRLRSTNTGVLGYSVGNLRRQRPEAWRSGAYAVARLAARGELRPCIAGTYALEHAWQAHAAIESRKTVGKSLIQVTWHDLSQSRPTRSVEIP